MSHSTIARSSLPSESLRPEIASACQLLLSAFRYAQDTRLDPWQFAVEIEELRIRGASYADLRWLVLAGLAEHRCEITAAGDESRSFQPLAPTDFPRATVLMLTPQWANRLASILPSSRQRQRPRADGLDRQGVEKVSKRNERSKPIWDQQRRELCFRNQLIKRFRVPAPNQEMVLQAFQEEAWPSCIDDPLPPQKGISSKGRLLTTVKSLNRSQLVPLLSFHGNGNGMQVSWEPRGPKRPVR